MLNIRAEQKTELHHCCIHRFYDCIELHDNEFIFKGKKKWFSESNKVFFKAVIIK